MDKKFIASISKRTAQGRSQGQGGGATIVYTGGTAVAPVSGNTHSHDNLVDLNKISIDGQGYEWITQLKDVGDALAMTTEKVMAGYADIAGDLAEDSPVRSQFLSRLTDDIALGRISFQAGLQALALAVMKSGAEFGDYTSGLTTGMGGAVDQRGNAEFESVRVRTYFECLELIINRLSAIEGDQLLTEADTIESLEDLGDNCYRLKLREKWEGYYTAISSGSVLKGMVNTLSYGGGAYYTSWMRVNSVNPAANTIEVSLYAGADCPSGTNYPPTELMRLARWGHQTDTARQTCLYLSSTEGRIVKLKNVTQPIISEVNYAATFGTVPEFVYDYLHDRGHAISPNDDVLYADAIAVRHLYYVPKGDGTLPVEYVDRGAWAVGGLYYHNAVNPAGDPYKWEISEVWHSGCKWRCLKNLTTEEPRWNSTDWAFLEGNPTFWIEFEELDGIWDADNLNETLTLRAWLHNQDVTADIADADVVWTRDSLDGRGNPRPLADTLWAQTRAGAGKQLTISIADIGIDSTGFPRRTVFTCTATLRDGMASQAKITI